MWGDGVVGYGSCIYTYANGKGGREWPTTGFAPRKTNLTVYIMSGFATFSPLLANPRTLIYVCGLAGMQVGVFRVLARHGHSEAYLNIKDEEVAAADPAEWERDKIKRYVRPTKRCMLEVY